VRRDDFLPLNLLQRPLIFGELTATKEFSQLDRLENSHDVAGLVELSFHLFLAQLVDVKLGVLFARQVLSNGPEPACNYTTTTWSCRQEFF